MACRVIRKKALPISVRRRLLLVQTLRQPPPLLLEAVAMPGARASRTSAWIRPTDAEHQVWV